MADYRLNIPNPTNQIMQNLNTFMGIKQFQQQQELFRQQQQDRVAAQQKAVRQEESMRQMQAELSSFASLRNPTARDYLGIVAKYPDMAASMKQGFDIMSSEQQKNRISQIAPIFAALETGQPSIAKELIDGQVTAFEDVGDQQAVAGLQAFSKLIDASPDSARTAGGILLASVMPPEEFQKTLTGIEDARIKKAKTQAEIENYGVERGLTRQQIKESQKRTEKIGAEIAQIDMEMAAKRDQSGRLKPEDRFDAETKTRKEYFTNNKEYIDVLNAYRRVEASEDTAAGDLALIFNYMKMLDPGSVVREGEFATAQNTTGVPDRVKNIYNKLIAGERLNPAQRKGFKHQSKGMYKAAKKTLDEYKAGLQPMIKEYGLNADNIFNVVGAEDIQNSVTPPVASDPLGLR